MSVVRGITPLPTGASSEATLGRRFGQVGTPKKAVAALVAIAGDSVFITPTVGKSLRVLWVAFVPSSDNANANLVQVKFGVNGAPFYLGYALAHWEVFEGATNVALYLNLAVAQAVAVTIHYEEFI